jgi:uncharacterized protein YndB with AHSA1/START domain
METETQNHSRFVYVTYIHTTPEKLWAALTQPEFTKRYWGGSWQESEWKPGASWCIMLPNGEKADDGRILEIHPPRRLVLAWNSVRRAELAAEGESRATYEIEDEEDSQGTVLKLTVIHEIGVKDSKLIKAVSNGWPFFLASLKTMLETGEPLPGSDA